MNDNVKHIEGINAIYQYEIIDENRIFQLSLSENEARVTDLEDEKADCVLVLAREDFLFLILGELSGFKAIMSGKLKVKGDVSKAIKMESILKKYNLNEYFC